MKLTEVFTKPKGKIKVESERVPKKWDGVFSVGSREFRFMALIGAVDDSELYPYEDKVDKEETWNVEFVHQLPKIGQRKPATRPWHYWCW